MTACGLLQSFKHQHVRYIMKKITDRKVIMGEFFVTSEGLAFCLFPSDKSRTACGAIVKGEHEGFASGIICTSDEPIASAKYMRARACGFDLCDIPLELEIVLRYSAPVVAVDTAYIVPKSFKCGDFKFGDTRLMYGYRPLYEVE